MSVHKLKLRATWSLGRSNGEKRWMMSFEDMTSGVQVLRVEMTPEQFGCAIGSHSTGDIEGELVGPQGYELVGREMETGLLMVDIGGAFGDKAMAIVRKSDDLAKAIADGWEVSDRELQWNHHRMKSVKPTGKGSRGKPRKTVYKITMHKWKDA